MTGSALRGGATASGTRRGADSFAAGARVLGRTGWTVSPVGFGASRVRDDAPLHRRALADALRGGVNLIDTSAHASDGSSERLVGRMLANLVQLGELRREQVVLVSRIGQEGAAGAQPLLEGVPEAAIVRRGAAVQCLHPLFLRRQLMRSLDRLGVERIDVVLLQEPSLGDALRGAFAELEAQVAAGRLGAYGVSSRALSAVGEDRLDLAHVLTAAAEVGGDGHHLGVVRLPLNLFELGAAHPMGGPSTLDVAARADVGVLAHRSLEAFVDREPALRRLADVPEASGDVAAMDDALARARKLEAEWAAGLGRQLMVAEDENAVDLFRWGQELSPRVGTMSLEQWRVLRHDVVAGHLARTSAALLDALDGEVRTRFAQWWERYGTALHGAFEAIEAVLRGRRRDWARRVADALDPCLPPPWRGLPLSNKAILTALTASVSCVAVGMRQPGYVRDVLGLREHPVRLLGAAVAPVDMAAVATAMHRVLAAEA